jgi:hypothetical protein
LRGGRLSLIIAIVLFPLNFLFCTVVILSIYAREVILHRYFGGQVSTSRNIYSFLLSFFTHLPYQPKREDKYIVLKIGGNFVEESCYRLRRCCIGGSLFVSVAWDQGFPITVYTYRKSHYVWTHPYYVRCRYCYSKDLQVVKC